LTKLLFLFITSLCLYSQVTIEAPKTFIAGQGVAFSISASGKNVNFPQINSIDGFAVQNQGTSNQTTIINGKMSQTVIKQYVFYPTKDIIIPSFDIDIDGNVEHTNETKISLQKASKTQSSDFDLTIEIDKKKAYVGEEIVLTITFKYRKNLQLYDLKFSKPTFNNFWSKQLQNKNNIQDNTYNVQKLSFLLFPQKSGVLTISPINIIALLPDLNSRRSLFGSATKKKIIYSNELNIKVEPLPSDVTLIGDFNIKTTVNKNSIKVGEAVSFQLEISGRGNIDDLEEYILDIPKATIYDNKSKKDFNILNGKYGGVYKKSYSIVASDNFTIPAIELKYFDKISKQIKTVKSKEYTIKVDNTAKSNQQLEIKKGKTKEVIKEKTVYVNASFAELIQTFLFGFLSATLLFGIIFLLKNKKIQKNELSLEVEIKNCKTITELLKKMTPYVSINTKLDSIIYEMESNKQLNFKKIKRELISIVQELKL